MAGNFLQFSSFLPSRDHTASLALPTCDVHLASVISSLSLSLRVSASGLMLRE